MDITPQVAIALRQPLEWIVNGNGVPLPLSFQSRRQQNRADALIPFLVQYHQSLGLAKA